VFLGAVLGILFIIMVIMSFAGICLRLVGRIHLCKLAKISIGNEVSIHRDKGAKLAFRGILAFFRSDYSRAITHLEKAMEYSFVSHNNAFCLDWLAQCYDAQEKYNQSLECCVKAVQVEPSNIKSLFNLADMYVRRGLFEKAEFYYNRILRYDGTNAAACFMIGALFMGRGRYDEAQEQFLKTLDIDAQFVSAMAELSVVCAIKGDYSKMDSYYAKAENNNYIESDRLKKRLNSIKKMQELCEIYDC
jgi:tetratricopeptide (TPR) repeat protein